MYAAALAMVAVISGGVYLGVRPAGMTMAGGKVSALLVQKSGSQRGRTPPQSPGETSPPSQDGRPPKQQTDSEQTPGKTQAAVRTNEAQQADTQTRDATDMATRPLPFPDRDTTMSQLLRLWGVFGAPVDTSCRALKIGELRCVRIHATFEELVDFNRPALLEFAFEQGTRTVLLADLENGYGTLVLGNDTRRVPRGQIKQLWTGQARLIWRQPIDVRSVQPGFVGGAVIWIRRQIARVRGTDLSQHPGGPSLVYGQTLERKVRTFQRRHGLAVDGIVGPRTMIAFNSVNPAPGTPVLLERKAD